MFMKTNFPFVKNLIIRRLKNISNFLHLKQLTMSQMSTGLDEFCSVDSATFQILKTGPLR